ncbi:hypothetical protein GQ53DRAFT_744160 [Thozetella sp. PMI_491]|nr:hypothetical protein GQ53DRAFT_744160 [Thozetella sp. PMI_491]
MDPVSLTASVMGIAKTVSSVVTVIRWLASTARAPAELADLQNELETVYGYLNVLRPILENLAKSPRSYENGGLDLLCRISHDLDDDVRGLSRLIHPYELSIPDSATLSLPRLQRFKWRREIDAIIGFRDKVRHRRVDLSHAVALLQPGQR